MTDAGDYDWPPGWCGLLPSQVPAFLAQLRTELAPDHPFQRMRIQAIGTALGSDDAVFAIEGWQAPFFVAHLAWPAPDTRPWLLRKLRPYPRYDPAIMPLPDLAVLATLD